MKSKRENILNQLDKDLPKGLVHTRKQHGAKLDYIAGFVAIEQANRIFGHDNWGYTITHYPEIIKYDDKTWYCHCSVQSWVNIDGKKVKREDVGFKKIVFTKSNKPMLEVAFKGVITDALKRALRAWGNQFGNALYDKEEKMENIKAEISTKEETELSKYIKKLMDCDEPDEVEQVLHSFNKVAMNENWSKAQKIYIKNTAERVKSNIKKIKAKDKNDD